MQIGNVSVEQMAMSMGSDPDHLVEALEEVFGSHLQRNKIPRKRRLPD